MSLSCRSPAVSSSAILTFSEKITLPVSISCFRKKVVTPLSFSPLMMAWLIGAAPRYCGNREACRLMVPLAGISQTISGNILKATTTCKSACNPFNSSINKGSLSFSGCSTFKPFDTAYCFTALSCSFCPRPAGLSAAVTTPTTSKPACTKASKEATAKSGVPIKTNLIVHCFR
ncbi:hypothetical protein D3C86_1485790 [compost metagenome]